MKVVKFLTVQEHTYQEGKAGIENAPRGTPGRGRTRRKLPERADESGERCDQQKETDSRRSERGRTDPRNEEGHGANNQSGFHAPYFGTARIPLIG